MRPSLLEATLSARFQEHMRGTRIRPSYMTGPPGCGKTQLTAKVARDLNVGFISLHAPLMLNEDFGMPNLQGSEVIFATPGYKFPFVDSEHFPQDAGIIAVEEVAQCGPDQQKIWANLYQERELHGRKLKPGWMFVATGNRIEDRAGAGRILSHFADRFTTYEFEASLDDWCLWALNNGVRPEVVGFLRFRPDLLSQFDPSREKSPTPRAWAEGVSPVIDAVPPEALFDTLKGDVGEGAASEFTAFLTTFRELPNPDMVIANPKSHPVPTALNVSYALSGALAHRANADNFAAIIDFAMRMEPEFTVFTIRDATERHKELQEHRAYMKWATGPGADLLFG